MINNPFTSDIFMTVWSKHFNKAASGIRFACIQNLLFVRHSIWKIYINYGKNLTKGVSYHFDDSNYSNLKGKVLLLYDVPKYFEIPKISHEGIKSYRIKQYPGFLIELDTFRDLNEYMVRTFKKSSRYKLKKYMGKLESCFDINYKTYFGAISKEEYDSVFNAFQELLIKRFDDKQITNNNLNRQEWDFYNEVAYPMILNKKASLFVIYNGKKPIAVTLNYLSEEILFDAITVFDIDYAKFHVGSVTIMRQIEWCLTHGIKKLDFSKGYFDYKKRWATKEYDFEYHILYDTSSLRAMSMAFVLKAYFCAKQWLRDKNLNENFHKMTYKFRTRKATKNEPLQFKVLKVKGDPNLSNFTQVDHRLPNSAHLTPLVFDFLYLKNESFEGLKIYSSNNNEGEYLIQGKANSVLAKINQEGTQPYN